MSRSRIYAYSNQYKIMHSQIYLFDKFVNSQVIFWFIISSIRCNVLSRHVHVKQLGLPKPINSTVNVHKILHLHVFPILSLPNKHVWHTTKHGITSSMLLLNPSNYFKIGLPCRKFKSFLTNGKNIKTTSLL